MSMGKVAEKITITQILTEEELLWGTQEGAGMWEWEVTPNSGSVLSSTVPTRDEALAEVMETLCELKAEKEAEEATP